MLGASLWSTEGLIWHPGKWIFTRHRDSECAPLVKNQGLRQRTSEAKYMWAHESWVSKHHSAQKERQGSMEKQLNSVQVEVESTRWAWTSYCTRKQGSAQTQMRSSQKDTEQSRRDSHWPSLGQLYRTDRLNYKNIPWIHSSAQRVYRSVCTTLQKCACSTEVSATKMDKEW